MAISPDTSTAATLSPGRREVFQSAAILLEFSEPPIPPCATGIPCRVNTGEKARTASSLKPDMVTGVAMLVITGIWDTPLIAAVFVPSDVCSIVLGVLLSDGRVWSK